LYPLRKNFRKKLLG